MYNILLQTHSILRWILIISLLSSIVYAAYNKLQKNPFEPTRKISLITLIFVHLQFLIGLILYFVSPKVIFSSLAMKAPLTRFFLVEHISGMLIAIILITIGYSSAKKIMTDPKKFNRILVYYIIGFLILLASVPWPFYNFGTGWI